MLNAGVDAVTEVPPDRWNVEDYYDAVPNVPGKMYTLAGAFLDRVDQFDPQFFGITPREALSMDPQQRLFLEICWEALQRSAHLPDRLSGSKTAVIVGGTTTDYMRVLTRFDGCSKVDAHFASGTVLNAIAGRVSYLLGLRGPAMAVDAACSSSLVAVHLACQGLRAGEFDLALAGGVNLILTPEPMVALCQARMLSPNGRCKTFDAAANGYVRGEGCGVVVLKTLSRALADGDPILAQIRGSAVNQDGKSSGFTVPNGPAQSDLIQSAVRNAGIDPADVGYLEAHGTGTSLGDPIEMGAAASVLGKGRPAGNRFFMGSVKTNIGHLESAAGIAGLIKSALVVQHGTIPPHLHFADPSPHIDWKNIPVAVPTEAVPWKTARRFAGVSSFGASGTNAHVVLEGPPPEMNRAAATRSGPQLLTLSGKTEGAVRELAGRYASAIESVSDVADFCFTANTCRVHYASRAAVVGTTGRELVERLARIAEGTAPVAHTAQPPRVAFLFTGQGSQYAGMGRRLFEAEPVFRDILRKCETILRNELDLPLIEVLFGAGDTMLNQTAWTQPALFVIEYGLATLWQSWGIQPVVVMGHSIGEYVAACLAGVFSLEEGLRLVAARGRLIQGLPADGTMVAVLASEAKVRPLIEPFLDRVSIAAVNAPESLVISGDAHSLDGIVEELDREGIACKRLPVSHAFHSPLMEPMLAEFARIASAVKFRSPQIRFISGLTGEPAGNQVAVPEYWVRHVRETVRFAQGIVAAENENCGAFLEIGPKPILTSLGRQCVANSSLCWLSSLREGADDLQQMRETLGALYSAGAAIDWPAVYQGERGLRRISIPTYPFQRKRFWPEAADEPPKSATSAVGREASVYQTRWEALPTLPSDGCRADDNSSWILFADRQGVASALAQKLGAAACTLVRIPPSNPDEVAALLAQAPADARLLFLKGLDVLDNGSLTAVQEACRSLVESSLPVLKAAGSGNRKLWLFTRNAAPVDGRPVTLSQAAFCGLARVFAVENPQAWGGLIDVGDDFGALDAGRVARYLKSPGGEDQVAFRAGGQFAARLLPLALEAGPPPVKPDGLYVISGGFGSLGFDVAEWLVSRGARHLALISRSSGSPKACESIARLEKAGAEVLAWKADVADGNVLEQYWRSARRLPIRGVIHAAGVLDDGILAHQTWERFERVLSPKIMGAWRLYQMVRDQPLDFFFSFSSVASLMGSVGQGNYAMANAFLDGFAHFLRHQGLPGISVQWGPWDGGGMAATVSKDHAGMPPLNRERALVRLGQILSSSVPQAAVFAVDWKKVGGVRADGSLLKSVCAHSRNQACEVLREVQRASPDERYPLLYRHLQYAVGETLGMAPRELDGAGFADLGMDSLMAVELRDRLQRELGVTLSTTLAFNYPTVEKLTRHLLSDVLRLGESEPRNVPVANGRAVSSREPIAIVGMACRLPGGISSPRGFWDLLRQGRDAITPVRVSRPDWARYFDPDPEAPGKMYVREAAFLDEVDQFDPQFFGISPREASIMDPQQRLLLEVCWEALENASFPIDSLPATGMFLGIGPGDYLKLAVQSLESISIYHGTGNGASFAAGRISHALGLQGPCLAIDTACSSSLVAIHLACQSLNNRECAVALAGGVQLMLTPESTVFLCKSRALSPLGRCKTFDESADGYVRGEGCGVVVLKRLPDAVADGDSILAVVRGSAVNHDGRSSGLTVPNGLAQEALLRRALENAGVQSSEVAYVEAHGTGTPLGDPIEVEALGHVFAGQRERPLLIGSVKTNIGHLELAAGIAGVLKVVLAIQHGEIPPHLNFKKPNSHIPWERIPIQVPRQAAAWPQGRKRIAGVSAFGLSGTNAHVVIEEPPGAASTPLEVPDPSNASFARTEILALSAKTPTALKALAGAYRDLLAQEQPPRLPDVCFTANACRPHFEERACFLADSSASMAARLAAFCAGSRAEGSAAGADGQPGLTGASQPLFNLARRYAAGERVDWSNLYGGETHRKVPLPNYPFQRKRYWCAKPDGDPVDVRLVTDRLAATGKFSPEALSMVPELVRALTGKAESASDCCYEQTWRSIPGLTAAESTPNSSVLIFGGPCALAERLERLFLSRGQTVLFARPGSDFKRADRTWTLNPARVQDFERLFAECTAAVFAPLRSILYVAAEAASDVPFAAHQACIGLLHLVQALGAPKLPPSRLWVITHNSVPAGNRKVTALHSAPLWGFGKVIVLEHPERWGGMIDISSPDAAEGIVAELDSGTEEFVALHDGQRYVLRLESANVRRGEPVCFSAEASYLITGGLGALGMQVAEWLVRRGARDLCLVSRQPASVAIQARLDRLQPARISCVQADVASASELRELFSRFGRSRPPLAGIIHAAGVPGFEPIASLTPERFDAVLRAKVAGGWLLHELSREHALDHFICFSSIAAVWGSKGQAHYAAANHFLDALALYRQGLGLPGLSVNWGPWSGGGMATGEAQDYLRRMGIVPLPPAEAFDALDRLAAAGIAHQTVANVDWPAFRAVMELRNPRRFFEAMTVSAPPSATSPQRDSEAGVWLGELASLSAKERRQRVAARVSEEVARILQLESPDLVHPQHGFFEMGMDSLMAVELSRCLKAGFGLVLTPTLAFDYPTVPLLADYLIGRLAASENVRLNPPAPFSAPDLRPRIAREIAELESLIDGL
jgi:acyl transferase domain-containing protein/acyl carrier protein